MAKKQSKPEQFFNNSRSVPGTTAPVNSLVQ